MSTELSYLLSPAAIRERARAIFERASAGQTHFRVRREKLGDVAAFVTDVTLANYPDLRIPFHSRWGHFQAGGKDRLRELEGKLAALSTGERARAKIDLAVVSVLLDAGSGPGWSYLEKETGLSLARSEGLAIASFRMFLAGAFSADRAHPLRADEERLVSLSATELEPGFQVTAANPLIGVEGRLGLLRALGEKFGRPGALYDGVLEKAGPSGRLPATELLLAVLQGFGPIWPGRITFKGVNLGDVWEYAPLGAESASFVPFHKLSQWLTYSLIEPLEESGLKIEGVHELTGLAEYRNGGLLLDRGLIELRDPALARQPHAPSSELIIEWRALTVVLLEEIAREVRKKLGKNESELPLAKVLEGGTWWAGRKAAAELRPGGGPPLQVASDGTVF